MSHRNALLASIALTIAMALGIFVARDRLFLTGASPGTDVSPAATTVPETNGGSQRIIEVTLPESTLVPAGQERDDEKDVTGASGASHDADDHDEWEDDEHEEYGDD